MEQDAATRLVRSLFLSWYGSLVRYALRSTRSLNAAEDVVQESFMALYLVLIEEKEIHNPKGWTLCVVRREIGKWNRDPRRNCEQLVAPTDLDSLADPRSPHENSTIARSEADASERSCCCERRLFAIKKSLSSSASVIIP